MKNAIITACDAKYGDFLVNHWMKSLKENVDTSNTDIIIFDYGLTENQRKALKNNKARIVKCKRDGHVNIVRLRDISGFLNSNKYDHIMITDGGDLIFQEDITELFREKSIAAVCEDRNLPFQDYFLKGYFKEEYIKKIRKTLRNKRMINCGVLVGPSLLMKKTLRKGYNIIIDNRKFGPDQVAINYLLYKEGFHEINDTYNYVIETMERGFRVKKGVFYFDDGSKIKIVHNAGRENFFRPIRNFGYGKHHNKPKWLVYHGIRFFFGIANGAKRHFSAKR